MNKTVIEDAKLYNDFADFLCQELIWVWLVRI